MPHRLARFIWSRSGLLCFLAVVLLGTLAKPAYHKMEAWRATSLLAEAERAGAAGDAAEQGRLIRVAFLMAPWKPETMRAQGNFYAGSDPERAIPYFATLLRQGDATDTDRRALLDLSLATGSIDSAKKALASLPDVPEFWRAEAEVRLSMLESDWISALWSARKSVTRFAGTSDEGKAGLLLVEVLRRYPSGDLQTRTGYNTEILYLLVNLFKRDDEAGMQAVSILSVIEASPPPAWPSPLGVETIAARLYAHPLADLDAKLNAAELRLKRWGSEDPELQRWMDEMTDPAQPAADRREVALWLTARNLPKELLKRLPWQLAIADPELCFLHMLALARTGSWFELRTATQNLPEDIIPTPVLMALEALAIQSTDGEATARPHWDAVAQSLGYPDPHTVDQIALVAREADQHAVTLRAYRKLSESRRYYGEACERLLEFYALQRDAMGIRSILADMASRAIDDREIEARLVYFNLLLKKNLPDASETAVARLRTDPKNNDYRINAALAALRGGDPELAESRLLGFEITLETPPSHLAIYALVMAEGNRVEVAQTVLDSIDPAALLPEEIEFADRARAKLGLETHSP